MIDPAIIDMVHHMSRQPPAIVQTVAPAGRSPDRAPVWAETVGERYVRAFEAEVADWVAACDRQVADLMKAYEQGPVQEHHLAMLSRMIDVFEEEVEGDAKAYRRMEKRSRRIVKQAKSLPKEAYDGIAAQRERILNGLARWGLARVNAIQGLRGIYARHHSSGQRGPVFDDHRALGDYLRAAVA